ncbi:hypothetical protein [Stenotrophomonas muris]|uniref:hypothetical protein n=1 Tax=Stenotrophomonas muris TaxID=2963283 RepID=UPI00383B5333
MSGYKSRIDTINTLLAGSPLGATNPADILACIKEFDQVLACARVKKKDRKDLLQILHSSRATDGFLKAFVATNACYTGSPPKGMGGYLFSLCNHTNPTIGKLSSARRHHYQQNLVSIRNQYLHAPDHYPAPTSATLPNLLSEMQACIAEVVAL